MGTVQTARSRALAAQDDAIASNVAKIEAARQSRATAIDLMASRLNVTTSTLTSTLKNTVFKGASDAEFVALVLVANAYGLNPLTKEIYAFPAKGGGIIPYVSIDGWVRIVNEHPAFDGIEFNDIVDEKGNLYAIESVIYRRDRSRPIKVTEYMDECRGQGPAWQKTPKRVLRHRSMIQGARIAFGFSGIYAEGDEPIGYVQQDGGETSRSVTLPTRQQLAEHVNYDPETGEIDEAAARALDSESFAAMEGRSTDDHGDQFTTEDVATADDLIARCARATVLADVKAVEASLETALLPDVLAGKVEDALAAARGRIGGNSR